MKKLKWGFLTLAVMLGSGLLAGGPAWSDDEGKLFEMVKEAKVTVDQAIRTATDKVQGTVVEAELEKKHGKTIWEVEVINDAGKVSEVHIDAVSGAVIDVEDKKAEEKKEKGKGKGKKD